MRHDCDCDCNNDNFFDHIYTGDEIIPWTLDYPGLFRPNNNPPRESKSLGSLSKHNWSIKFHAFLSKAFQIAIVLPIASFIILAIAIIIYMLV